MMYIFRYFAKRALNEVGVIRVDPSKLSCYCEAPFYDSREHLKQRFGKKIGTFLSDLMFWRSFFNPSGDWDLQITAVTKLPKYKLIKDLWQHRENYVDSTMYKQMQKQLQTKGYTKYKKKSFKNIESLNRFFESYMLKMLYSMQEGGYDETLDSEIPRAAIDREGKLIKSRRGRHRFAAAQVVGVAKIPLEIDTIHPEFIKKIEGGFSGEKLLRLKEAIKRIEKEYS